MSRIPPEPIRVSRVLPSWRLFLRALRSKPTAGADSPSLDAVPDVWLENQTVDPPALGAYLRFCGWPDSDRVPLPYFFVLGFLPQTQWLTHSRFPLKAMGMVHVSNTFELFDTVFAGDSIDVRVGGDQLEIVEKGRRVRVKTDFLRGSELVARSVSTSFARGGGHGRPGPERPRASAPVGQGEIWQLDGGTGRRYARVSGDYNPIHLSRLTARVLGFPKAIAHGMYLVGRAVARLEVDSTEPFRYLEARFKTPTFLPGRPRFYVSGEDADRKFELWNEKGDRPHLVGICRSDLPPR